MRSTFLQFLQHFGTLCGATFFPIRGHLFVFSWFIFTVFFTNCTTEVHLYISVCSVWPIRHNLQITRVSPGGGLLPSNHANVEFKVWLNRYSWGVGKQGSGCVSWFRRLECISRRFLTMLKNINLIFGPRNLCNPKQNQVPGLCWHAGNTLKLHLNNFDPGNENVDVDIDASIIARNSQHCKRLLVW